MIAKAFNSQNYRYAYQGQEKDDEIAGSGNSYTAEYWQYDPRLGRRWNIDPIIDEAESPYVAFKNIPILLTDPNGDCATCPKPGGEGEKEGEAKQTTAWSANGNVEYTASWYWHSGTVGQAGWYQEEEYAKVIAPVTQSLAHINGDIKQAVRFPSKDTFYEFLLESNFDDNSYKNTINIIGRSYSEQIKNFEYANGSGAIEPVYPEDWIMGGAAITKALMTKAAAKMTISLGKMFEGSLIKFAGKVNAPYMNQWRKLGLYTMEEIGDGGFESVFKVVTSKIVKSNGKIHFNLNGVNLKASKSLTGKGLYDDVARPFEKGLITEWELNQIINSKDLLKNTTFYKMGIEIPHKTLMKYY